MTFWLGYCPSAELWLRTKDSQGRPCTCRHLQCPVAFSVARASVASQSRRGAAGAQLQAVAGSPLPLGPGKGLCCGGCRPLPFWACAGTPCPFHSWLVLQMCELHVMPSASVGNLGPPKGVCAGRGREGMWLLPKRTQGQGQERKGGKKNGRKVVTSGCKVIMDWLSFICAFLVPSLLFCLQQVLDF